MSFCPTVGFNSWWPRAKRGDLIKCIICEKSRAASREHIIPEVLGGTLVTYRVCVRCNNDRCAPLDNAIVTDFLMLTARIKHRTPRYSHAKRQFYASSTLQDGTPVNVSLDSNGRIRFRVAGSAPVETLSAEGEKFVSFRPHTNDAEKVLKIARRVAQRYGLREPNLKEILAQLYAGEMETQSSASMKLSTEINLVNVSVAATKIAYEFAADTLGAAYVADEGGAAFRELITRGLSLADIPNGQEIIANGAMMPAYSENSPFKGIPDSTLVLALVRDDTGLRVKIHLLGVYEGAYAMTSNPHKFLAPGQARIYFRNVITGYTYDKPLLR